MLHILWVILKCILILLGIVLGLLLLAVLLLLFCPVCYSAEGSGNLKEWKKAKGRASLYWLFWGIGVTFTLEDGKIFHSIRIFGIPLEKLRDWKRSRNKAVDRTESAKKKKGSKSAKPAVQKKTPKTGKEPKPESKTEPKPKTGKAAKPEIGEAPKPKTDKAAKPETGKTQNPTTDKTEKPGFFQRIRNKFSSFLERLKKIPEIIRDLRSNMQKLYEKIDRWHQFFAHPRVQEAISFAWRKVKRLLGHIAPTRIEGDVTFGCEDPSVTGMALAALGITIPFHKNCIEVHPLFEGNNHLEGEVKLRGRVYGIVLAVTAAQIYFHKNIKYVISRWKNKEEAL